MPETSLTLYVVCIGLLLILENRRFLACVRFHCTLGVHHYGLGNTWGSHILRALTFHEQHSRGRCCALSLREDLVWAFSTKVRDLLWCLIFIMAVPTSNLEVHGLLRLSLIVSLDVQVPEASIPLTILFLIWGWCIWIWDFVRLRFLRHRSLLKYQGLRDVLILLYRISFLRKELTRTVTSLDCS
jgi:hypothetical protein